MNLGNNQAVSSLSGTVAATGSATLDIASGKMLTVNQSSGDTIFGGTLNNSGTLDKQGTSKLTLVPRSTRRRLNGFGRATLQNRHGGTLTLAATTAPTISSGVTATVANTATLELAGSVSQLNQGVNISSAGTLLVSSSVNQNVGTVTGTGIVKVNSGASLTAYQIRQNSLTINGSGVVTLLPSGSGSTAAPANPNNINYSSTLASLSIAGGINAWTGTLDIGNNGLFIAYGSGADPYIAIDNMIASGFNGGSWTGTGITSSLARAAVALGSHVPALNIGLVDFTPGLHGDGTFIVFEGQTVTTNAVLLRLTYMDDMVLAGDMLGADATDDALLFAANYGAGTTWGVGDLTHDGAINPNDALLFAANYSTNYPSLDRTTGNAVLFGAAAVPEPASAVLAIAALGVGVLFYRRSPCRLAEDF